MVKCADCGFLALRDRNDGSLAEADSEYRITGSPMARERYKAGPICLMQAHDLNHAVREAYEECGKGMSTATTFTEWYLRGADPDDLLITASVIGKERCCPEFTKWLQGSTPKEHREMLDRQWRMDRQRKWDQEDQDWRENRSEANEKFRADQRKIEREWQGQQRIWRKEDQETARGRFRWEIGVFGGLVVAAIIVAALLQSGHLFPREQAPLPVEITLHEPVASDSEASQEPTD